MIALSAALITTRSFVRAICRPCAWLISGLFLVLISGCAPGSPLHGDDQSGGDEAGRPRHLILIVIDTLRADAIGCYGGPVGTPHIDALADAGVRFERAYSHIPITGPSHASLFTSLLPLEHGVQNNGQVLAAEHLTLAEMLSSRGWYTAAFISLGVLMKEWGLNQGFSEYHHRFKLSWSLSAGEVNQHVLPWLEKLDHDPAHDNLFLWVHYSDPHAPYAPPGLSYPRVRLSLDDTVIGTMAADGETCAFRMTLPAGTAHLRFEAESGSVEHPIVFKQVRSRQKAVGIAPHTGVMQTPGRGDRHAVWSPLPATFELTNSLSSPLETILDLKLIEQLTRPETRARYFQEVEYVDSAVGELVAALKATGLWQRSLVILTSDHGEGLGDHNLGGHAHQLYDSLLQIPLIMVAPGHLPAGTVSSSPVSLIDILPTTLDLLGIEDHQGLRGHSILPLSPDQPRAEAVLAETYRPQAEQDLKAVVDNGYKYILSPDSGVEELYDLDRDPGELSNLATEQPEMLQRLRTLLAQEIAAAVPATGSSERILSKEESAMLQALGYATSESTAAPE